jgi:hypothetical protein
MDRTMRTMTTWLALVLPVFYGRVSVKVRAIGDGSPVSAGGYVGYADQGLQIPGVRSLVSVTDLPNVLQVFLTSYLLGIFPVAGYSGRVNRLKSQEIMNTLCTSPDFRRSHAGGADLHGFACEYGNLTLRAMHKLDISLTRNSWNNENFPLSLYTN